MGIGVLIRNRGVRVLLRLLNGLRVRWFGMGLRLRLGV